MIHGPAFYKLLDIPESVTEPTAYHLLRIDPRLVSPALVDSALKERKLRLRRNIPGPQFIPIVSMIERELERAAEVLRDPRKRRAYDARLVGAGGPKRRERPARHRRKLVEACRRAVRETVDGDGCLADADRGRLAQRLSALGLPESDVRYVLERIPRQGGAAAQAPPERQQEARAEAMAFFLAAIDLEVDRGVLTPSGERKLMAVAARFGIDDEAARERIDGRLKALGAGRGTPDASSAVAQFKGHVLAMFPEGHGSDDDRRRLLSLAAAEGLSQHESADVLEQYLGPSGVPAGAEADAALAADPLPILEALAADAASAPAVPRPAAPRRPDHLKHALVVLVSVLVLAVGGVGYLVIDRWPSRRSGGPDAGAPAVDGPGGEIALAEPAVDRSPLLAGAFEALQRPDEVRKLLDEADPAARAEALEEAAGLLVAGGTPRERVLVEALFEALLHCPSARPPAQTTAFGALVERLREAAGEGDLGRAKVYRAAGLLASLLFLRPTPGVVVTDSGELHRFLDQCERAFAQSRRDHPSDPANDPKRLAYAVMEGGDLMTYGRRADAASFTAVLDDLIEAAADPNQPGSRAALSSLLASGGCASYGKGVRRVARLALCRVLARTPDVQAAARTHATLASCLSLDYRDPLRSASLDTPGERAEAAAKLRRVIETGRREIASTRPTATRPTTGPATRPRKRPRRPATLVAQKVRASWGTKRDSRTLLTDLAATMLACADRVASFTPGSDVLTREVLAVAGERDALRRAERLTRHVRLPDPREEKAFAGGAALGAEMARRLEAELRSLTMGVRYRAIEELQRLDSRQAADILLKRLEALLTGAVNDLPTTNRILRALTEMNDPQIPPRLAAMIQPARSNYAAHRVAMTLLEGTGYLGSQHRWRYRLAINHNADQRKACAGRWKTLAVSCAWGRSGRMARAIAGPTGAPPAWRPDPVVEKLVAAFVHHARLTGELLKAHRAGARAGAAARPEIRPARMGIHGPTRDKEMLEGLALVVAELTRLAREHPDGRKHAVKIDMIRLGAEARELACETALQRAAVRLGAAGKLLEVLVLETNGPPAEPEVARIRGDRERGVAASDNVLVEMRESCYQVLALLEMLPAEGP